METRTASSAAVSEVLNVDNYLVWSVQVKTYLIAQDLWDIVEATNECPEQEDDDIVESTDEDDDIVEATDVEATDECPKQEDDEAASKDWRKKNAMALHMIQISCPQRICHVISLITSAKIAWEVLESICSIPKRDYFVPEEGLSYVAWSDRMKTILMRHNLWNIVETTTEPTTRAWSKKNALALYLIRESCDPYSCSLIGKISMAKIAWDTMYEFYTNPNSAVQIVEDSTTQAVMANWNRPQAQYASFQKNIQEGKLDAVNQFISNNPEAVSARITRLGRTALHFAIFTGHENIVTLLVNNMSEKNLEIKDNLGYTVLGCCAIVGNIQMASCIIEKNRTLLSIGHGNGPETERLLPVVFAILHNPSAIDMVRYLYKKTPEEDLNPERGINGVLFVNSCLFAKYFDLALHLINCYPQLVTSGDLKGLSPMVVIANLPGAFPSGSNLIFWKQWIYNSICISPARATDQFCICIPQSERDIGSAQGFVPSLLRLLRMNQIYELKLLHHQSNVLLNRMCENLPTLSKKQLEDGLVIRAIFDAVKRGVVEFVDATLKECPEVVWRKYLYRKVNIFMLAVEHRRIEVFRRLCKFAGKGLFLAEKDIDGNSILHIAAIFESSARRNNFSGAAFHMQSEIQWFKEVKSLVNPSYLEYTNKDGKTPQELFTECHKDLVKEGENWMKGTATSCTVVGALIITIMFAAAITVPGGNDQNKGFPVFLNKKAFVLFIICDALSLVSASTSVLMFLGILTSHYAEEDFLTSLPKKMIIGLLTLIFSITTMMITFCASLFIILHGKSWVAIPVACFAGVPVVLYAGINFRLIIEMAISTYGSKILDKKAKTGS